MNWMCCALVLGMIGCSVPIEIEQEVASPDGRYLATVASVDGGAISSTTYFVTLRESGQTFTRLSGKIFRGARHIPRIRWDGDRKLVVRCQCDPERIEVQENHWRDVEVLHQLSSLDEAR